MVDFQKLFPKNPQKKLIIKLLVLKASAVRVDKADLFGPNSLNLHEASPHVQMR